MRTNVKFENKEDIKSIEKLTTMMLKDSESEFSLTFWNKDNDGDYHQKGQIWKIANSDNIFYTINNIDVSINPIVKSVHIDWNEYSITFSIHNVNDERVLYVRIPDVTEIDVIF